MADTRNRAPADEAGMEPSRSNRRDSPRRLPRNLLSVECRAGIHGLGPSLVERALDISETGMSFAGRSELASGAPVQVVLFARGHSGSIKAIGQVVRCEPMEGSFFEIALQFERRLKYSEYQLLT